MELAQLSGLPAAWSERFPPLRLLLGSTFTPWDVLTCLLGAALGGLLLARWAPRRGPRGDSGRVTSAPPPVGTPD